MKIGEIWTPTEIKQREVEHIAEVLDKDYPDNDGSFRKKHNSDVVIIGLTDMSPFCPGVAGEYVQYKFNTEEYLGSYIDDRKNFLLHFRKLYDNNL